MTFRFKSTNISLGTTGSTIAHGLGATPDEYFISYRGAPQAVTGAIVFFSTTPVDATNVYLSCQATSTVDLFAAINHSIIR